MTVQVKIIAIAVIFLTITFILIHYTFYYGSKTSLNTFKNNLNPKINSFAVYYGDVINSTVIKYLNNFQLVILLPCSFNSSLLNKIMKIAYIDLGEYDNNSKYKF